jgi:hypothetical protein
MNAIGFVFEPVDLHGMAEEALVLLHGAKRKPDLFGRRRNDLGELPGTETDRVEAVQADEGCRGVDCIHHVIE